MIFRKKDDPRSHYHATYIRRLGVWMFNFPDKKSLKMPKFPITMDALRDKAVEKNLISIVSAIDKKKGVLE